MPALAEWVSDLNAAPTRLELAFWVLVLAEIVALLSLSLVYAARRSSV
jgi:hypothetical protein